jgi:hypothetical protein
MRKTREIHERLRRGTISAETARSRMDLCEEAVDVCLECAHYEAEPDRPDRCIYWDDCDIRLAATSSGLSDSKRSTADIDAPPSRVSGNRIRDDDDLPHTDSIARTSHS